MKQDPTTNYGLTRRSFVKRSVVAAVAVSSMTIFSGLVDASTTGTSGLTCKRAGLCSTTTPKTCPGKWEDSNGNVKGFCRVTCDSNKDYVSCDNSSI